MGHNIQHPANSTRRHIHRPPQQELQQKLELGLLGTESATGARQTKRVVIVDAAARRLVEGVYRTERCTVAPIHRASRQEYKC